MSFASIRGETKIETVVHEGKRFLRDVLDKLALNNESPSTQKSSSSNVDSTNCPVDCGDEVNNQLEEAQFGALDSTTQIEVFRRLMGAMRRMISSVEVLSRVGRCRSHSNMGDALNKDNSYADEHFNGEGTPLCLPQFEPDHHLGEMMLDYPSGPATSMVRPSLACMRCWNWVRNATAAQVYRPHVEISLFCPRKSVIRLRPVVS